jgi:hypothetical protein
MIMSSPFCSDPSNHKTIENPADPGQTAVIRKMTGIEDEAAQAAHNRAIIAGTSARGWSKAFQRLLTRGAAGASEDDARAIVADPLLGYDRVAVIHAGLVSWSYPKAPKSEPDPVLDLDDDALDWLAREVLRLTRPALFDAGERKND